MIRGKKWYSFERERVKALRTAFINRMKKKSNDEEQIDDERQANDEEQINDEEQVNDEGQFNHEEQVNDEERVKK